MLFLGSHFAQRGALFLRFFLVKELCGLGSHLAHQQLLLLVELLLRKTVHGLQFP